MICYSALNNTHNYFLLRRKYETKDRGTAFVLALGASPETVNYLEERAVSLFYKL